MDNKFISINYIFHIVTKFISFILLGLTFVFLLNFLEYSNNMSINIIVFLLLLINSIFYCILACNATKAVYHLKNNQQLSEIEIYSINIFLPITIILYLFLLFILFI